MSDRLPSVAASTLYGPLNSIVQYVQHLPPPFYVEETNSTLRLYNDVLEKEEATSVEKVNSNGTLASSIHSDMHPILPSLHLYPAHKIAEDSHVTVLLILARLYICAR